MPAPFQWKETEPSKAAWGEFMVILDHNTHSLRVVSRSQCALHMHVLVCICSNVRQFLLIGQGHTQMLCYKWTQAIAMLHTSSCGDVVLLDRVLSTATRYSWYSTLLVGTLLVSD